MKKTIQTQRAKPNPIGKDRNRSGQASATQLGGEWVDVRNYGQSAVSLNGVILYHMAYKSDGSSEWEQVISFQGSLPASHIVRIHSGSGPLSALRPEDIEGAHHHLFTGKNYVWNNDKGDSPLLYELASETEHDRTYYDPNPPEGVVLNRMDTKLQP